MFRKQYLLAIWVLIVMFVVTGAVQEVFAAGDSSDGSATETMKKQLRSDIVGTKVFPGEDQEYVIGHGDVLSVVIYGEGNMAATSSAAGMGLEMEGLPGGEPTGGRQAGGNIAEGAVVRTDGRVSLLHIGDVNVLGMTMTQATDYLTKLYATVYSNPMVTVSLMQSNSRRYTVMGEIRTPGVFNLDYPVTVVQAIARSGGFTEWAKHSITVARVGDDVKTSRGEEGKTNLKFDYDDLVKGKNLEQNIYLQSGDIVIVH
ncbi:MAG: polysaccharide biosynthesis/export family protein [Desulfobulbus oligotrophicus]|jgi:polysaccharide export outer membrane protein|nr:polysaccharide biosynthesis/export family protein [Desulfobulbus oligotrophicus]